MRCSLVIKVSPPFEGGVAGTTDCLTFTRVISRPGWLIYSFLFNRIFMNNKILFNRINLKSFRSSLSNRSSSAEAALWEVIKSRIIDGRKLRKQSTTPAATNLCNTLIIYVLRPPLLQKESLPRFGGGKLLLFLPTTKL